MEHPAALMISILVRVAVFVAAFSGSIYSYDRLLLIVERDEKATGRRGPATTLGVVVSGAQLPGTGRWVIQLVCCQLALAWVIVSTISSITF